ncbi:prepilin-type N-terminal cleavage/methylation domain-containing protein [Gallaecimonas sp. GXIMD4217]|uniref:prepilin-type N-terminal cleavage/methylation domain-containing protein n=1 Tax=Gallaecimonas sp. GXIMD4217 TaxID=3131927 RepID=UPI00311AD75B
MSSRGFTLVELVAVLVVLAIVGLGVSAFLRLGAGIYADNRDRSLLVDRSRFLAERLGRELRLAAPNSLRLSSDGRCLEFVPIRQALAYDAAPIAPAAAGDQLAVWDPDAAYVAAAGDRLVINPLRFAQAPLRARDYFPSSAANAAIDAIAAPDGDGRRLLALAGAHQFPSPSPGRRAFVYGDWQAFCLQGDRLLVMRGVPVSEAEPAVALRQGEGWSSVVLASGLTPLSGQPLFTYDQARARVQIRLRLGEKDESMELYHGVAIPNSR